MLHREQILQKLGLKEMQFYRGLISATKKYVHNGTCMFTFYLKNLWSMDQMLLFFRFFTGQSTKRGEGG